MAKVWNRAFWRPAAEQADDAETPHGEVDTVSDDLPETRRMPRAMVTTAAALVLVGVGLTAVSGPLYGYAERPAADLVGGVAYIRAVLPEGIR